MLLLIWVYIFKSESLKNHKKPKSKETLRLIWLKLPIFQLRKWESGEVKSIFHNPLGVRNRAEDKTQITDSQSLATPDRPSSNQQDI